jgi:acyl-CoA synthetase (AMP-forming)/AMP-acid ligase II
MHVVPRDEFTSVAASIRHWARNRPDDLALLFLADGENESARLSFGELDNRARHLSGRMIRAGLSGQPVLVPALSEPAFLSALCGCLYAGAIAVPSPFNLRNRGQERIRSIATDAGVTALIAGSHAAAERLMEIIPGISSLSIDDWESEPAMLVECDPQQPALLQYTSGSTSAPKGVVISHRNLVANIAMLGEAFGVHASSRMLTWLPLFHDMGLIGNVLPALYWGIPCVVMPPLSFLQKPRRWLEAITRHGITISGGPNFAYELCARRLGSGSLDRLDLSSWELAFCGAEPVRLSTMRRFAQAVAGAGFRGGALYPCYGLAEATVFVSGGRIGQGVRALPAEAPIARELVSCGRPPGVGSVTIVDPDTCEPLPDGSEGEVWVCGDHVAAGYWNNAAATASTFAATLSHQQGPFVRTGDLGLMWQNELYITGRRKSLIIHRGINLHPEDIESAIGSCHPGFGAMGAAFSIEANSEEQVVVVYEVLNNLLGVRGSQAMIDRALDAIAQEQGVRLFDLVLVRAGTVPRTTSGKVQRDRCRTLYLSGELARIAHDSQHPSLGRCQAEAALDPAPFASNSTSEL